MLIVEDGSGRADADSFFALVEADMFLGARGVAAWDNADGSAQQAAARQAADYLGTGWRWPGVRSHAAQRLCFPRRGMTDPETGAAVPADAVPRVIVEAAMWLAAEALAGNLMQAPEPGRAVIEETKELAGVGRTTMRYADAGPIAPRGHLVRIDAMLTGWALDVVGGADGRLMSRAAVRQ